MYVYGVCVYMRARVCGTGQSQRLREMMEEYISTKQTRASERQGELERNKRKLIALRQRDRERQMKIAQIKKSWFEHLSEKVRCLCRIDVCVSSPWYACVLVLVVCAYQSTYCAYMQPANFRTPYRRPAICTIVHDAHKCCVCNGNGDACGDGDVRSARRSTKITSVKSSTAGTACNEHEGADTKPCSCLA